MMTPVILLMLVFVSWLCAAPTMAQTSSPGVISWINWQTSVPATVSGLTPITVTGVAGDVTVTFTGIPSMAPQLGLIGTNYWNTNPATYTGSGVTSSPTNPGVIRFQGGPGTGTQTLTFSKPVTNPVMTLLSLGGLTTVQMDFGAQPFEILKVGPGHFGTGTMTQSGNVLTAKEGNGLIRFIGTMTSITWTTPVFENWSGFTIGIGSGLPPPGRLIAVMKVGDGTGTVVTSIGNVNCGIAPAPVVCLSNIRLPVGTVVTITAQPSVGSRLGGWVGLPVACSTPTCTFLMPTIHVQVRVTFQLISPNGLPLKPDRTPPTVPSIGVSALGPTSLTVRWFQVTDDEGVARFEIQRCLGLTVSCVPWVSLSTTTTDLSFASTGLTPETSYTYRVRAFDQAGNASVFSEVVTYKTPGLPVPGRVIVSWDPVPVPMLNPDGTPLVNHDGTPVSITGYHVWRSLVPGVYPVPPQVNPGPAFPLGAPVGSVLYGTNTYTDLHVFVGITYYYVVTSYNMAGDSLPSNEVFLLVTVLTGRP